MEEKGNPESRFQAEMTRKIDLIIQKLGGYDSRFDKLEVDVSEIKQEVTKNTQKLDILNGQFSEVTKVVIQDGQRITKLETEVADLQSNIH